MRTLLIPLCAVLAFAAGCREASLDDLRGDAQVALDEARNRAQAIGELSADELSEIWAIEYRTLLVPDADFGTIDEQLNALGQERWSAITSATNRRASGSTSSARSRPPSPT